MAYYYMDEDNKVKVTEIFDVTKAETEAIFHDSRPVARNPGKFWESDFEDLDNKGERSVSTLTYS